MLLSEMVRNIKENILIEDTVSKNTSSTSWVTVGSYNITLTNLTLLMYKYYIAVNNTSTTAYVRLKINSLYIGGESINATTYTLKAGVFALPAGTYTVELQLKNKTAAYYSFVDDFYVWVFPFPDVAAVELTSSSPTNINLPSRKTCIGSTKNATLRIQVYNSSEPTVTVDGKTLSAVETDTEKFVYCVAVSTDSQHTITVSAGSYAAVLCPWLLPPSDAEMFTLTFPQGSTLYLVLEPFMANPTKTVKLGKKRLISFGDATDYYSTASGTGILQWNYTFESLEVEKAALLVSGYGGCISIIAVDVRA